LKRNFFVDRASAAQNINAIYERDENSPEREQQLRYEHNSFGGNSSSTQPFIATNNNSRQFSRQKLANSQKQYA